MRKNIGGAFSVAICNHRSLRWGGDIKLRGCERATLNASLVGFSRRAAEEILSLVIGLYLRQKASDPSM